MIMVAVGAKLLVGVVILPSMFVRHCVLVSASDMAVWR
jgi:hypothetical protein